MLTCDYPECSKPALPKPANLCRLAPLLPREVGVLRPDLLAGVNAPDGGPHRVRVALALPLLRVLLGRCRMWVVAKRLVRSNPPFSLAHRIPRTLVALICRCHPEAIA